MRLCLAFAALALLAAVAAAQPAGDSQAELKDRIVIAYTRTEPAGRSPFILEHVQVRRLAGVPFLVGRALDDPNVQGPRGAGVWLPLDNLARLVVVNDRAALKKLFEK